VVLELVVDEVPASGDGDEVADEVYQMTAIPNPWSLTTGVSRGDGDARLETTAASVIVGELEMLQKKGGEKISLDAPEREEMEGEFGGEGVASPRGCRRKSTVGLHGLRRGISPAWRLRNERGGEEKGEGVSGFIGEGLMAS
jgi:hypothetical protein